MRQAGGQAQAVRCDVSSQQQQEQMFEAHMQAYGRLDTAVLNAGIGETGERGFRYLAPGCRVFSASCLDST